MEESGGGQNVVVKNSKDNTENRLLKTGVLRTTNSQQIASSSPTQIKLVVH